MLTDTEVWQLRMEAARYFELSGAILVVIAADATVKDINAAGSRLLGYDRRSDIIGKNWFDNFVPPSFRVLLMRGFKDLFLHGSKALPTYENPVVTKDGTERIILWNNIVLRDSNRKAYATLSSGIDVTDRRKIEESLRKRERALTVLSQCNQALVRAQTETGLLESICRIIVEVGGYRMAWIGFAEDDQRKTVRPVASAGYGTDYITDLDIVWADKPRGHGPTGTAIREGRTITVSNILTEAGFAPWRTAALKREYESSIAVPLKIGTKVIGALNIYAAEPGSFDKDEQTLLDELALDMAYGLDMLRLRESHRQANERIAKLASFPDQNPMPVLEIGLRGDFHYLNPAAKRLFPDIEELGFRHPLLVGLDTIGWDIRFDAWTMIEVEVNRHWYLGNVYRVPKTDNIRIYATDITERRWARNDLEVYANEVADLYDKAPCGYHSLDAKGVITRVNATEARWLGYRTDEMVGRPISDFVVPEDQAKFKRDFQMLREHGKVANLEYTYVRQDGSRLPVLVNAVAINDSRGNFHGSRTTTVDDTQRRQASEALRASEEQNRRLFEASPWGMHLYELESSGRLVFIGANPAADRILGVANSQFIGKTIEEAFPPLQGTEIPDRYRSVARDGVSWGTEQVDYEHGRIKGAFEVQAFPLGPNRMAAAFVDIAARVRAQAMTALQLDLATKLAGTTNRQAGLRLALAAALRAAQAEGGGIYLFDGAGNLTLAESSGLPNEFVTSARHYPPNSPNVNLVRHNVPQYLSLVKGDLTKLALSQKYGIKSLAIIPIRRGHEVVGSLNVASFKRDEVPMDLRPNLEFIATEIGGTLVRLDITAVLEEDERRYRSFIENTPDIVFSTDAAGNLTYVGPQSRRLGFEPANLTGKPFLPLIHEADRSDIAERFQEIIRSRGPVPIDVRVRDASGNIHWFETIVNVQRDGKKATGLFGILRDITDRKANEEAARQNVLLKDKLLLMMSRQFRPPLAAASWGLQELIGRATGPLTPAQEGAVRAAQQAIGKAEDSITDLTLAMDIAEGRFKAVPEPVIFEELIRPVCERFRSIVEGHGYQHKHDFPVEQATKVMADPALVQDCWRRLLDNAILYSRDKGLITATITRRKGFVRAEIADEGIGIPKFDEPRIFERFHRASNVAAIKPDSAGLSLFIVKNVIESMGGHVGFQSEEGKGSRFWLELPVTE